jgi:hypothetical protein
MTRGDRVMKRIAIVMIVCAIASAPAMAGITVYTDQTNWAAALTAPVNTINWDDVALANGTSTVIAGNRYAAMVGSPTLSIDAGSSLYVIDPGPKYYEEDFIPVSGENVFSPDDYPMSPEGVLTVSFATPMNAIAAWFLDVEYDYASTGIEIAGTLSAFGFDQGDDSTSFLGIVSTTPFTTAKIHMSSAPGGNGVGIDDLMYSVPAPGAAMLGILGLGAAAAKLRKRRV